MTKCNIEYAEKKEKEIIIPMSEMKPLEIGEIVERGYNNCIVMRTESEGHFEVMNLTEFRVDECWSCRSNIKVKLLNATLTVTIHGNLEER